MRTLEANKYREMLLYGGEILNGKKEQINALNVFPVPDGDTGSNMNMTIQSGVQAISNMSSDRIDEVAKTFSKGLLMGARGNSGVILSQFFRGVSEGLEGKESVNIQEFHEAIKQGVTRGYGSVINAVEGTILTVIREMSENTKTDQEDFLSYFEDLFNNAETSLNHTPELLPVLKEVGVVDSGGAGILAVLEGMLANLKGEKVTVNQNFELFRQTEEHPMNPEDIEFGFCTEMLIKLNDQTNESHLSEIRQMLETFGDSIVCIIDEDILKVHVHTETPLKVFEFGMNYGEMIFIKSENMRNQAEEAQKLEQSRRRELAMVAVASSEDMGKLFQSYYEDIVIISGGQTLNPSIEDIVNAVKIANAKDVIFFPNNSNIIMAAENAVELVEDCNLHIVKTKHMTQALECIIRFDKEASIEENITSMKEIISDMINIEITNSIKDTTIDGLEIKENDFMAIIDGKIKYSNSSLEDTIEYCAELLVSQDCDVITMLVGEEGDSKHSNQFKKIISEKSPFTEVVVDKTNQPVYSYIISGVK